MKLRPAFPLRLLLALVLLAPALAAPVLAQQPAQELLTRARELVQQCQAMPGRIVNESPDPATLRTQLSDLINQVKQTGFQLDKADYGGNRHLLEEGIAASLALLEALKTLEQEALASAQQSQVEGQVGAVQDMNPEFGSATRHLATIASNLKQQRDDLGGGGQRSRGRGLLGLDLFSMFLGAALALLLVFLVGSKLLPKRRRLVRTRGGSDLAQGETGAPHASEWTPVPAGPGSGVSDPNSEATGGSAGVSALPSDLQSRLDTLDGRFVRITEVLKEALEGASGHLERVVTDTGRIRALVEPLDQKLSSEAAQLKEEAGRGEERLRRNQGELVGAIRAEMTQFAGQIQQAVEGLDKRWEHERLLIGHKRFWTAVETLSGLLRQDPDVPQAWIEQSLRFAGSLEAFGRQSLAQGDGFAEDQDQQRLQEVLFGGLGDQHAPLLLGEESLRVYCALQQEIELYQGFLLQELRRRFGVEPILPLPEADQFDPALHEARAGVPAPDAEHHHRIRQLVTPGVRVRGEVVRKAAVVLYVYGQDAQAAPDRPAAASWEEVTPAPSAEAARAETEPEPVSESGRNAGAKQARSRRRQQAEATLLGTEPAESDEEEPVEAGT
jgi:hypothetical protein